MVKTQFLLQLVFELRLDSAAALFSGHDHALCSFLIPTGASVLWITPSVQ